jgi:hypothetical protein
MDTGSSVYMRVAWIGVGWALSVFFQVIDTLIALAGSTGMDLV